MQQISAEKSINEIKIDQFIQPEKPKDKRMKVNEKKKRILRSTGHCQVEQHAQNCSPNFRGEKGDRRNVWKNIEQNISYLIKYVNSHIQEALRTPGRINSERPTQTHIIVVA